jgi:hypothetical protein
MNYLPNEQNHPHLAEFLRAGGFLEVGANDFLGSFARLRIGNRTISVSKMIYRDLAEALQEMEFQAVAYFEGQDKS